MDIMISGMLTRFSGTATDFAPTHFNTSMGHPAQSSFGKCTGWGTQILILQSMRFYMQYYFPFFGGRGKFTIMESIIYNTIYIPVSQTVI